MMELSSGLSVLFTTLEAYYQHEKAFISAFENVQYHGEISSPLGGMFLRTAEGAHHTGGENG